MKVWYLVANNGDGSSSVHFFQDQATAQALCDDESKLETYGGNEGGPNSFDILPDGTTTIAFTDAKVAA